MARTSAKAKKSKQEVNKKKEEATKSTDSEGAGESTDKENDSTNYDVEKITHTRIYKGKRQYLVRWKGYTEDEDTWENESTLQSSKEILDAFKKEHLAEENSEDEIDVVEEVKEKKGRKEKKTSKKGKKSTRNSGKAIPKSEDEYDDSEEELEKTEVKAKEKKGKSAKGIEESEETKGQKRKSEKGKEISKAKKTKKDESDDDDESVTDGKDYEVEKIIEVHTRKDGTREFLIRWKGYRPAEDTWEPEEHLDCLDLIEKFMEKVDKAKEVTRKELRQRTEKKRFVPLSARRVNQRNSGLRPCYTESYYED